jgi:hypothetical protein
MGQSLSLKQRVLGVYFEAILNHKKGPLTAAEIASIVKCNLSHVHDILSELEAIRKEVGKQRYW